MNSPEPSATPPALERDVLLGEVRVVTHARVRCPFCWTVQAIELDPGSGAQQEYVEDCPRCCMPWQVQVRYHDDGRAEVAALGDDER